MIIIFKIFKPIYIPDVVFLMSKDIGAKKKDLEKILIFAKKIILGEYMKNHSRFFGEHLKKF